MDEDNKEGYEHQAIQSDVPLGMSPETNSYKEALTRRLKERQERELRSDLPVPPCHYCAKGYVENKTKIQYVFCSHPKKQIRNAPIALPLTSCQKHYEAMEWGRAKREKETEERKSEKVNETEEQTSPTFDVYDGIYHVSTRHSEAKTILDKIDDGTLEYACERALQIERIQMKNLPCLDHSWTCPRKECNARLTKLITASNERDWKRRGILIQSS
jgi:adenylate kinase family enzyme